MDPGSLAAALAAVVADSLGVTSVEVQEVRRLSGGASRESWSFDAIHDGGVEPLILRRAPAAISDAIGPTMMLEAAAMREAARVGVPSPQVLFATADKEPLGGSGIVMSRVDGETIGRKIVRDDTFAEVRPRLARQCGEVLGRLHGMDPAALPPVADSYALDGLRALLDESKVASPMLELALRWLELNRPVSTRRTVVHGDFRNGNLVVGPDGLRAVLDWELIHLGDPIEDLGWLCTRAWRFGGDGPVGGFGEYDDLLAGYEATSGQRVDLDVLRWWELLGTVKWGVICIVQANRHLVGGQRSVELAAVGRRLVEQEYDCLELLEELTT
ncbi:MAG TPA: phosphotransferase family protein [Mycobacteriales bacterium]|nr:phosphotransferase family protein [Mycobacteriales bacterium]